MPNSGSETPDGPDSLSGIDISGATHLHADLLLQDRYVVADHLHQAGNVTAEKAMYDSIAHGHDAPVVGRFEAQPARLGKHTNKLCRAQKMALYILRDLYDALDPIGPLRRRLNRFEDLFKEDFNGGVRAHAGS